MTRRIFNRKAIKALCGPGVEYIGRPRYDWPHRSFWPGFTHRRHALRLLPGKERGAMNKYAR